MQFDRGGLVIVVLVAVLVVGPATADSASRAVPVPALATTADVQRSTAVNNTAIRNVTFSGKGTAETTDGRRVVWRGQSFEATVNYQPVGLTEYTVCIWTNSSGETCKQLRLGDPANRTAVTIEKSAWPVSGTGPQDVTIEIRAEDRTLDRTTREIVVLRRNESYDGDALSNHREVTMNTSVLSSDTDDDGLRDGAEIRTYETDPTEADTDDDGLIDGAEINKGTDPLVADTDGDGLDDGREVELGTDPLVADTDGDGLDDGREVELGTDPTEADTDGDGLDDGREVELGTNPRSSATPVLLATGVAVTLLVVGTFVNRRRQTITIQWRDGDGGLLLIPSVSRGGDENDESEADDGDETSVTPVDNPLAADESANGGRPRPSVDSDAIESVEVDRETVLRMLHDNNGRVRQRQIVENTDWSAAKVSRVLSKMDDDEQISKVTIGRENIVTFHGEEPGSVPSDDP